MSVNTIQKIVLCLVLSVGLAMGFVSQSFAGFNEESPRGFLWYNLPEEEVEPAPQKQKMVAWNKLSYQMRTKVLRYYTMESLHKAIASHDAKDVETFLELQQYWHKQAAIFKHNFQYALLQRPDLDSTVKNPVSALGTKLNQARYSNDVNQAINSLTRDYGLLFFYKGADVYSQKQAGVLASFASRHGFHFVSVSVDGQKIESLPDSRLDSGQAKKLGITYFPAIVLVHPKTGRVLPVAHGFVTQDYLSEQMMVVALELKKQQLGEGVFNV